MAWENWITVTVVRSTSYSLIVPFSSSFCLLSSNSTIFLYTTCKTPNTNESLHSKPHRTLATNLEIRRRHEQERALWPGLADVHTGLREAHDVSQGQYDDWMLVRLERFDHRSDPSHFISIDKSHTVVSEQCSVNASCKKNRGKHAKRSEREATCGVWLICGD